MIEKFNEAASLPSWQYLPQVYSDVFCLHKLLFHKEQNRLVFNRDTWCHQVLCLQMILLYWCKNTKLKMSFDSTFFLVINCNSCTNYFFTILKLIYLYCFSYFQMFSNHRTAPLQLILWIDFYSNTKTFSNGGAKIAKKAWIQSAD